VALRAEALTASHRTGPGRGQESQMGAGPDWGKKYGVVAGNTRRFAEKLRSVASDVEGAFAGKPVPDEGGDPDGAAYLGVLKQEFRTLTPFLARSDRKAMEAAREAILESEAGRVGMNGAVLLRLLGDRATLASAKGGSCKAALAELKSLGATLAAQGGTAALAPVVALTNALGSRGAEQPVASVPGAAALLSELDLQLGEVVEELRTQVDLPPAASLAKTYQRLQGSYQRRWMERMRQGEVGLIRAASVAALLPDPPPEAAARLAAQYARLVEWRARNLYVARRTSAGVDVTARDAGMTMRLPPHIAKEFFRARTRATPEDFRAAIEEYYRDLYRNLSY
jgi:hypothetical protein